MLIRGFEPDVVTYNIRIDVYSKKRRFADVVEVFEDMQRKGFVPTMETLTTLVHEVGIARNPFRVRRVLDEITERGLVADKGAYNALMQALGCMDACLAGVFNLCHSGFGIMMKLCH